MSKKDIQAEVGGLKFTFQVDADLSVRDVLSLAGAIASLLGELSTLPYPTTCPTCASREGGTQCEYHQGF